MRGEHGAEDGFGAGTGEGGFDDHAVEIGEDVVAGGGFTAPERADGGDVEVFTEEIFAEAWEEHHECGGFEHSGAEGIGDGDGAGVDGLDEAGDAEGGIGAKFEGVAEFVILASEDDIDALETAEGFEDRRGCRGR